MILFQVISINYYLTKIHFSLFLAKENSLTIMNNLQSCLNKNYILSSSIDKPRIIRFEEDKN